MLEVPTNASLRQLQGYVAKVELVHGFDTDTVLQKCLLLGEEVGELFKALREPEGVGLDTSRPSYSDTPAAELADILMVVCTLASRLGIDLEDAFRAKQESNSSRRWNRGCSANQAEPSPRRS